MALSAIFKDQFFGVGDMIRVWQKIQEGEKERLGSFEGMVIGIGGMGSNKMFTVRRIGAGKIGIERIFPLLSPNIEKIDVTKKGRVARAKLYWLRGRPASDYAEIGRRRSGTKKLKNRKIKRSLIPIKKNKKVKK